MLESKKQSQVEFEETLNNFSKNCTKEILFAVRGLSKIDSHKTYLAFALDWTCIGAAIALSIYAENFLVYLFSVSIIAARQHGLLILMHEGAHKRISGNPLLNDFLSDYFAAIPIFLDTGWYRENHLQHHRYTNSALDPDWTRKISNSDWHFPKSVIQFLSVFSKYLLGSGILEWWMYLTRLSGFLPLKNLKNPATRNKAARRLFFYVSVVSIISFFSHWHYILTYWFIPYVFAMLVFQRLRSIAEHFGLKRNQELNNTRNVIAPRFEAFFFGPHNVCYHLDHHMFPSVPFYNLPKLHAVLMSNKEYAAQAHINTSYIWPSSKPVIKDLIKV